VRSQKASFSLVSPRGNQFVHTDLQCEGKHGKQRSTHNSVQKAQCCSKLKHYCTCTSDIL